MRVVVPGQISQEPASSLQEARGQGPGLAEVSSSQPQIRSAAAPPCRHSARKYGSRPPAIWASARLPLAEHTVKNLQLTAASTQPEASQQQLFPLPLLPPCSPAI